MTNDIDYSNWMGCLFDTIGSKCPWEIILPGTHNSGAFSPDYYTGYRNQGLDIQGQLQAGVRSFDIRIQKGDDKFFYMQHSGTTAASQSYTLALNQIISFFSDHPREIIEIFLTGNGASPELNSETRAEALDYTNQMIGNLCDTYVPDKFGTDYYSLFNMLARNKRIILISDISPAIRYPFWFNSGDWALKSGWQPYQSNGGTPPSLSVPWMIQHATELLTARAARPSISYRPPFLDANMVIWYCSPWIGKDYVNYQIPSLLTQWINKGLGRAINIISLDYIDQSSVLAMIEANVIIQSGASATGNKVPAERTGTAINQPVPDTAEKPGGKRASLPERIMTHARKTIHDNGLVWDNYGNEMKDSGDLCENSYDEIAGKLGIKKSVVRSFIEWYKDHAL